MSAKRFLPGKVALLALRAAKRPGVMILLLAVSLVVSGCATTSSQAAKLHKPQMITSDGVEVVGAFKLPDPVDHGFNLSDALAEFLSAIGTLLANFSGLP